MDRDLPARTEAAAHSPRPAELEEDPALQHWGLWLPGAECPGEVAPAEVCFPDCKTGQRCPDRLLSLAPQCLGMQVGPGAPSFGALVLPVLPL